MKTIPILLVMIGAVLIPFAASAQSPNILFILADDQRPDTISAYGNPNIETPNIDRIVRDGFSFRRNYCMGSMHGAVCVPSRAMIMSGQAYFRIPMDLQGVTIMPAVFRKGGYATFATGKWHNQANALIRGFEFGEAVFLGGMSNHLEVPLADIEANAVVNRRTGDGFSSEMFADAAVNFIANFKEDRPFFAYVAFSAPHDPRMPPESHRDYANRPPLPPNFMPQHPFDNGQLIIRDENLAGWPRTEEVVRDQLAEYYGMITHMDAQIGRILSALEKSGRAENTIIVYAADHGLAVGSHGLLGKQNLYEHSMGAPLIFAGPGIPKGQSSQALTYLLDIYPTLSEIAGLPAPEGIDGHSLLPIWKGDRKSVRDSIFLSYGDIQRAVVEERWKLIRYPRINHTQLFDLQSDPLELRNLAEIPAQSERVQRMTAQLADWQKRVGDSAALSSSNPGPKEIDITGTPRKPDQHQPAWVVEKYFQNQ